MLWWMRCWRALTRVSPIGTDNASMARRQIVSSFLRTNLCSLNCTLRPRNLCWKIINQQIKNLTLNAIIIVRPSFEAFKLLPGRKRKSE